MTFTIDDAYVRVKVYGLTIRKVALSDIAWADQAVVRWTEHYTNSMNRRRLVRLHRKTGSVPDFVITPKDPLGFLKSLELRGVEVRYPEV